MKPLNTFQLNVYNILCFICKCKQNLDPPYFVIVLLTEQKPNMRGEMKILFKKPYAEKMLVSILFHTINSIFGTKK